MLICVSMSATAQRVTYNHDDAKMNQVTVQETGAGTLTPDLYYSIFHSRYKKKAQAENKMTFRTAAGISAYQQIDDSEKLDSAMLRRARLRLSTWRTGRLTSHGLPRARRSRRRCPTFSEI